MRRRFIAVASAVRASRLLRFSARPGDRRMPAGPIEEEHGVGAAPDTARDLDEVELHRLAVGVGHGERRAGAARRADGAEQVGAFVALIGGLTWARAAPRPLGGRRALPRGVAFCAPKFGRKIGRRSAAIRHLPFGIAGDGRVFRDITSSRSRAVPEGRGVDERVQINPMHSAVFRLRFRSTLSFISSRRRIRARGSWTIKRRFSHSSARSSSSISSRAIRIDAQSRASPPVLITSAKLALIGTFHRPQNEDRSRREHCRYRSPHDPSTLASRPEHRSSQSRAVFCIRRIRAVSPRRRAIASFVNRPWR